MDFPHLHAFKLHACSPRYPPLPIASASAGIKLQSWDSGRSECCKPGQGVLRCRSRPSSRGEENKTAAGEAHSQRLGWVASTPDIVRLSSGNKITCCPSGHCGACGLVSQYGRFVPYFDAAKGRINSANFTSFENRSSSSSPGTVRNIHSCGEVAQFQGFKTLRIISCF